MGVHPPVHRSYTNVQCDERAFVFQVKLFFFSVYFSYNDNSPHYPSVGDYRHKQLEAFYGPQKVEFFFFCFKFLRIFSSFIQFMKCHTPPSQGKKCCNSRKKKEWGIFFIFFPARYLRGHIPLRRLSFLLTILHRGHLLIPIPVLSMHVNVYVAIPFFLSLVELKIFCSSSASQPSPSSSFSSCSHVLICDTQKNCLHLGAVHIFVRYFVFNHTEKSKKKKKTKEETIFQSDASCGCPFGCLWKRIEGKLVQGGYTFPHHTPPPHPQQYL